MRQTHQLEKRPGPRANILRALTRVALATLLATVSGNAQHTATLPAPDQAPHRIHLILRDGSYQLVTDYHVAGANVVYHSAERAGAEELVPLNLVDLDATEKWEQRHAKALGQTPAQQPGQPPPIDPELLSEEAARAALTPEVAPNLRLPELDSVLALDTVRDSPVLIPIAQYEGTAGSPLNPNTAHNILPSALNPLSSPHPFATLRGAGAPEQLHIPDPVFYVRIGDDADTPASGSAFTVDTHGNTSKAATATAGGSASSRYVVVRTDVRVDARVLLTFPLLPPDDRHPLPEDVTAMKAEPLKGGHWLRLTPVRPLDIGEFALVEILDDRHLNVGVWAFGVHPAAAVFRDAIRPEDPRNRHHQEP